MTRPESDKGSRRHTLTGQMLDWAVAHHEATGESAFYIDPRYRRAAAQHHRSVWGVSSYWVTLKPPMLHEAAGEYLIQIEPYTEGELWSEDDA